ncbi:MAG: NADP-dependent isocitrate dehydrogenase, partial [Actinobacteria bacterium]|nr:NADP-dependent isocitrate dehydrogenase [Actinomycetota bacterium]
MNRTPVPVTVARGDGIGPEIMAATLRVLEAAQARLAIEEIEIGEAVYKRGNAGGIEQSSLDSLRRTGVFLKAPITTPQGGGVKSLNVTVRKTLGLYANVRPCPAYAPFVATRHPGMDVVIIRENEEDLYAGIEHRQTDEVYQCLKLITRPGCERIARYAFEYARAYGRKKVTAFTKDNIMKMTDGLFRKVATEVAAEYPDIAFEHWIVDIGTAKLADAPEQFDVILLPNLYGDIISDVAAEIAGSVGLAGSANIGMTCAMFEAIHGSAPDIAGKGIANPSGLLLAAVQMLVHIGQGDVATTIHNAWLRAIEDGVHTADIFDANVSKQKAGTDEFASAVIARLGQSPKVLKPVAYAASPSIEVKVPTRARQKKEQVGIDVFLDEPNVTPEQLGKSLEQLAGPDFRLDMLSNRGQKVYPGGAPETLCVDAFRCRFISTSGAVSTEQVIALVTRLAKAGHPFVKSEGLFTFDGE